MTPHHALPRRIRRILGAFATHQDVTAENALILTSVVAGSQRLLGQFAASIRSGQLHGLAPLAETSHAAGTYDGHLKVINLPLEILRPGNHAEIAFVLGHELQHSLNNPAMHVAHERFMEAVAHAAQSGCNYTRAIGEHLAYQRVDEASANLAGWNAYVGYIRDCDPQATLAQAALGSWRSEDFVMDGTGADLYVARAGLTINADLSIDPTPANIEAVARHYFDKDAGRTRLGYLGTSDYLNEYGAEAVSQAAALHRYYNDRLNPSPIMIINATELGLSRKIMEENGIDLQGQPTQPYLDCSTAPPRLDYLHHTIATHRYVPIDHQAPARSAAPDPSVAVARMPLGPPPRFVPRLRRGTDRKRPTLPRGATVDPRGR
jgi:hypothetical protein